MAVDTKSCHWQDERCFSGTESSPPSEFPVSIFKKKKKPPSTCRPLSRNVRSTVQIQRHRHEEESTLLSLMKSLDIICSVQAGRTHVRSLSPTPNSG